MSDARTDDRHHTLRWTVIVVGSFLAVVVFLGFVFVYNNRPPNLAIPNPQMPVPNGYDDFVQAAQLMERIHHRSPLSDPNPAHVWTIAEYRSFVRDNAPATAMLRQGFGKPYRHPSDRGTGVMFPTYAYLREMARTLGGEAQYYAKIGDYGRAVDAQLDCVEFGVTLPKGGELIAGLVGSAVVSIGLHDLEPRLQKLNPEQLARAATRVDTIAGKNVHYSDILIEEAWGTASRYQSAFSDPAYRKTAWQIQMYTTGTSAASASMTQELWQAVRFAFANKTGILKENLQYTLELAKEKRGPYTGRSKLTIPGNALAQTMLDFAGEARFVFSRQEERLALLQTEIALLRFRADHGRYADRLDDLRPTYLKAVPEDPFGLGKPLKYKPVRAGKDFLLYSLGPDLKDDGGKPGKWDGKSTKGDLVAGKL